MSLRELFRQKLGNAEIVPDPSVGSKLMRKLARQEFIRFNPVRFNAYYLGAVMVVGITAAVYFSSGSLNNDNLASLNILKDNGSLANSENQKKSDLSSVQKTDAGPEKPSVTKEKLPDVKLKANAAKKPIINSDTQKKIPISYPRINETFTNKGLVTEQSSDKNKLQGSFRTLETSFESSVKEGCAPLSVDFYSKSVDTDSCRWIFGDGGYSDERNPSWIFDVEGEYKIILNVFRQDGSMASSSGVITVFPRPLVRFEISPEKAVLPKDEIIFHNYSSNADHYKWDFGDGSTSVLFEPVHQYTRFGNFNVRLVATSESGCSDSLVVMSAFSESEYFIDFPTAFIPNTLGPTGGYYSAKSDEASQVFHPEFSGVTDYHLKVFSKLGILIFESNDVNVGWDGYFKGQLSDPGVYIWKVRGNFRNGEPFIKMGDVTLLRYGL